MKKFIASITPIVFGLIPLPTITFADDYASSQACASGEEILGQPVLIGYVDVPADSADGASGAAAFSFTVACAKSLDDFEDSPMEYVMSDDLRRLENATASLIDDQGYELMAQSTAFKSCGAHDVLSTLVKEN